MMYEMCKFPRDSVDKGTVYARVFVCVSVCVSLPLKGMLTLQTLSFSNPPRSPQSSTPRLLEVQF